MSNEEVVNRVLSDYKPQAQRIAELEEQVKKLKSLVADLEAVIDDIPPMTNLWKAVRELQDETDAPAAHFVHYLGAL